MAVFFQSLDENNDGDGITITEQNRDLLSNVDLDLRTAMKRMLKMLLVKLEDHI